MNPVMNRAMHATVACAAAALTLSACGTAGTDAGSAAGSTSGSASGAATANVMPACTTELITSVAEDSWAGNPDQANKVRGVTCAGDWALATIDFVDTNAEDVAANGGEPPTTEGTLLFHYDGTAWGPNAGNDVCGTADMSTDPPAYPSDAQVPESIWREACWAS